MTTVPLIVGADGFKRPPAAEDNLIRLTRQVFGTAAGEELLDYLRSFTVNAVSQAGTPPDVLAYREGQRSLVMIINNRLHGD